MYINSNYIGRLSVSRSENPDQGRKLKVQGKADPDETSCLFCSSHKTKSRPISAVQSHVLVHPGLVLASHQRFNENRGTKKDCRSRRLTVDSRRMPLSMECLQTNLNNHTVARAQRGHNNTLISRTIILDHDRYLNRTMSLPILLEKKSVEIKPRYEPKQSVTVRKRVERPKEEVTTTPAPIPEKPSSSAQSTTSTKSGKKSAADSLIDHSISVIITDKRTRSVVRASSAASIRSRPHRQAES